MGCWLIPLWCGPVRDGGDCTTDSPSHSKRRGDAPRRRWGRQREEEDSGAFNRPKESSPPSLQRQWRRRPSKGRQRLWCSGRQALRLLRWGQPMASLSMVGRRHSDDASQVECIMRQRVQWIGRRLHAYVIRVNSRFVDFCELQAPQLLIKYNTLHYELLLTLGRCLERKH